MKLSLPLGVQESIHNKSFVHNHLGKFLLVLIFGFPENSPDVLPEENL